MINRYAISLFSGSGIGDLGYRDAGMRFISMCESEHDRAELLRVNYPESEVYAGDINDYITPIIAQAQDIMQNDNAEIFLISCTAPCQGMSKSGQGTLLRNIRLGKRPKLDPRNRLILPALEIIIKIKPFFVVFENVCEMRNTIIEDSDGELRNILDIIKKRLGSSYYGQAYDVEFADYGIPQRRKRLITVFTRHELAIQQYTQGLPLIPEATHSLNGKNGKLKWVSVMDAIKDFPPLDAKSKETAVDNTIPFHRVPILDSKKYNWILNTPPAKSAFDNQCINPKCRSQCNVTHGTIKNIAGINQSRKDTPLYCEKCGALLPRPYSENKDGSIRIMSGYTSAYKRMDANMPCPAITRNLSFACSDNKVHPFQNRVLSLAEAIRLQTISDYRYYWGPIYSKKMDRKEVAPDTLIRLVIGESIPPKFTELLGKHLIEMSKGQGNYFNTHIQNKLLFEFENTVKSC